MVSVGAIETGAPKDQKRPAADTSVRSVPAAGDFTKWKDPEDALCTWIECAKDQRSWAEVTEECDVALPCTPVPARVAGVGHKKASGHTEDPNHQVKPWLWERAEETDKPTISIEEK